MILKSLYSNEDMNRHAERKGFTLVELSLSMVFISTLSLAVVMVIAGAISSYHKSITMNQVNTVGTSLVDDMRSAVQQSSSARLSSMCDAIYNSGNAECASDGARHFISVVRRASVKLKGSGTIAQQNVPVFGAFCTGVYSYIWNSGYFFNSEYEVVGLSGGASLKYNSNIVRDGFKLLKVEDGERAVCVVAMRRKNGRLTQDYSNDSIAQQFNIAEKGIVRDDETPWVDEDPEELLSGGEDGLALYDLTATASEQGGTSRNIFYYTSFILGTVQGGVSIDANGGFCAEPEEYSSVENFDYCAINKFNFAALANGG